MFDSGKCTIHIDDPGWVLKEESSIRRWSRGASVSEYFGLLYAGISKTRKRYLSQISNQTSTNIVVQALSTETRTLVGSIALSGTKQVNNVYVVPKKIALALLLLDEPLVLSRK